MATPTEQQLSTQLAKLGGKLERRARQARLVDRYYEGHCPYPDVIVRARVTKAWRMLMPLSQAPWGALVVDSTQDRLEVSGIRSADKATDDAVWGIWQDNQLDALSRLAHNCALTTGRAYALVWPDADGNPEISIDGPEQMIVQYREGSIRHRGAALRYFMDDDAKIPHATLYRPEGIYKFKGPKHTSGFSGTRWERREVDGETWPLENPLGIVPAVELPVNRRLKPGEFGYARGEYEHCLGLIDRIHLLTFLGLVVAFSMGFPLRGVIGEALKTDDGGEIIPPFDAHAGGLAQLENPNAKTFEFKAAERKNLSIYAELDQFATLTKTPRHYLPMEGGMANLSADAIRASEGGHVAKIPSHKSFLGEGWEEALRIGGLMLEQPVKLSPRAELQWMDHESRSLAERADAASKLKDIMPWQAVAETALRASADQIARWEAQRTSEAFSTLLAEATRPVPSIA